MSSPPPPEARTRSMRTGGVADLLARNRKWAKRKTQHDPQFFDRLVGLQCPDYFWIGCSDSRVPATEIVDLEPGEMFVHRNVGNLVPPGDINFNATLLFAVDVLRVLHVMVVGHYGYGGVRAARKAVTNDAVGQWLAPVRSLCREPRSTLFALRDEQAREDRLCELNVIAQVELLSANPIIRQAWQDGRDLTVHGLIYAIGDGLLQSVCAPESRANNTRTPAPGDETEFDENVL